jgi:class 3 adenylate cyclase
MATCPACCVENPEGSRYLQRVWLLVPRHPDGREVRTTVTVVFCDVTGSTVAR